jgi:hypothetical protein
MGAQLGTTGVTPGTMVAQLTMIAPESLNGAMVATPSFRQFTGFGLKGFCVELGGQVSRVSLGSVPLRPLPAASTTVMPSWFARWL